MTWNVHPGWKRVGEYETEPDAPEAPKLIEWFYKNYPQEARRIEQSVNTGKA